MTQEQTNAVMVNASDNAKNIVASADGAAVSIKGLESSSKAAQVAMSAFSAATNMAITFFASFVINAAITYFNDLAHAEENAREESSKLTDTYESEQKDLEQNISQYKELSKQLDNSSLSISEVKSIKEQLLTVQDSLNEKYGAEVTQIDLVNGKYDEQLKKLNAISKKKAIDYTGENFEKIQSDEKYITEKVDLNTSLKEVKLTKIRYVVLDLI